MNHVATPTNNYTSMSLEDILPQCPTAEECAERLDGALDDILFKDGDGKMKPRVCFCCDVLLSPRESHFVRLSTVKAKLELLQKELQKSIKENNANNSDNEVHPELMEYYKYDGSHEVGNEFSFWHGGAPVEVDMHPQKLFHFQIPFSVVATMPKYH